MTRALSHLWYELVSGLDFDPFLSAFFAGFCVVGADGVVYLSAAGQVYLDGVDA